MQLMSGTAGQGSNQLFQKTGSASRRMGSAGHEQRSVARLMAGAQHIGDHYASSWPQLVKGCCQASCEDPAAATMSRSLTFMSAAAPTMLSGTMLRSSSMTASRGDLGGAGTCPFLHCDCEGSGTCWHTC